MGGIRLQEAFASSAQKPKPRGRQCGCYVESVMTFSVADLKEISPFLAVLVSILALTISPFIAGRFARSQAVASMRERWIYAFRDCLVELITEFDVLHEIGPSEGLVTDQRYEEAAKKMRMLVNRARLMVNPQEQLYVDLIKEIERTIELLAYGIKRYEEFHDLNDRVKLLAQRAIRSEWEKIAP